MNHRSGATTSAANTELMRALKTVRTFGELPGVEDLIDVAEMAKKARGMPAESLSRDAVEYEVDCLISATGFEVGTAYTRRSDFEVYGRGASSLTDYWAKGMKTHHGFLDSQYPEGVVRFYEMPARWREQGDMEGLIVA